MSFPSHFRQSAVNSKKRHFFLTVVLTVVLIYENIKSVRYILNSDGNHILPTPTCALRKIVKRALKLQRTRVEDGIVFLGVLVGLYCI